MRIAFQTCHEENTIQVIAIKYGIVDVAAIKDIRHARFMDEFVHLGTVIFLGHGYRRLLRNGLLFAEKGQTQMYFDACLRLAELGPLEFL